MSTSAYASVIIPKPIEEVWAVVREFNWQGHFLRTVRSVDLAGSSTQIGAVRRIEWASGEVKRQELVGLSDVERTVTWETLESVNFPGETAAETFTVSLRRVSENNATFVSWLQEFSNDVSAQLITFAQDALQTSLGELSSGLMAGKKMPSQASIINKKSYEVHAKKPKKKNKDKKKKKKKNKDKGKGKGKKDKKKQGKKKKKKK